jgi:ADP-ribose pyrophosphatase YjhB (NUDIX family)
MREGAGARVALVGKRAIMRLWGRVPRSRFRSAVEWSYTPKFLVDGFGVVVDERHRVLLVHHTYKRPCPWGLPGGGMRYGETIEQAVAREILEEAGTTVEVMDCLATSTDLQRRLVKLFYRCTPRGHGFCPSAEVDEAGFFAPGELPPGTDPAVVRLLSQLPVLLGPSDSDGGHVQ